MTSDTASSSTPAALERFVAEARPVGSWRALVVRDGFDIGRDAAADALAWAVEHWAEVASMANPVGYLYRVGPTSAKHQLLGTVPMRWFRSR